MATHFMRVLSWMMVPGLARTPLSVAGTQSRWRAGGRRAGGSRATPTPLGLTNPPSHTQDCYPALQGEKRNTQSSLGSPWAPLGDPLGPLETSSVVCTPALPCRGSFFLNILDFSGFGVMFLTIQKCVFQSPGPL